MAPAVDQTFNLIPDSDYFEYDPLDGSGDAPEQSHEAPVSVPQHVLTVEERIDQLFDRMRRRRRILLGIIDYLRISRLDEDVATHIESILEHDVAVFDASNYVVQLERAGAIARYNSKGEPYAEEDRQEPEIVEVNGQAFYKPAAAPELYWEATAEGIAYLDRDDPAGRLAALVNDDSYYLPIYQRILSLCSADGGVATPQINAAINDDPLLQAGEGHERVYASYFTTRLESCDAIRWEGAWVTTESGKCGLQSLFAEPNENETL